jgi:hypothetical protein
MKEYELIVEKRQPSCGGKPPLLHDFSEIETDDPIAYVKAHTKNAEYEVDTGRDGSTIITTNEGGIITRFIFTEI